jgi:hypothetical protein
MQNQDEPQDEQEPQEDEPQEDEGEPSAEAPPEPATVVTSGKEARDPHARVLDTTPSRMRLATWAASKRGSTAAFQSWARTEAPDDRTAEEWSALFAQFSKLPVKG